MKKAFTILLAVVLAFALFSGCGSSSKSAGGAWDTASGEAASGMTPVPYPSANYDYEQGYAEDSLKSPSTAGSGFINSGTADSKNLAEKIIYSASAEVETMDFDGSIDAVYAMLERYDAFLESSYVSGVNYKSSYNSKQSYRYANFTIRVPSDSFGSMTNMLSDLGNVIYLSTDTDNITSQFYDLGARLKTYETEEERLLNMLESAETVEEMILIEERLSNVRYNIESAQTTLNSWQTQVDYSTVRLHINEVEKLTEKMETHLTYGEEISQGFRSSLKSVGNFFKELFKDIIVAFPVIVIVVAVAAAVVVIGVRSVRRRQTKRHPKDKYSE